MQIKQEASTSSENQAKTIEADWLLGESCHPWANSKDSCLLSSVAGNTEHFLSTHFLQSLPVVIILGEKEGLQL